MPLKERKLWKKKMIDVHTVKKNKKTKQTNKQKKPKNKNKNKDSLHDLPCETKKQDLILCRDSLLTH